MNILLEDKYLIKLFIDKAKCKNAGKRIIFLYKIRNSRLIIRLSIFPNCPIIKVLTYVLVITNN